jgi:hypothetical protein
VPCVSPSVSRIVIVAFGVECAVYLGIHGARPAVVEYRKVPCQDPAQVGRPWWFVGAGAHAVPARALADVTIEIGIP